MKVVEDVSGDKAAPTAENVQDVKKRSNPYDLQMAYNLSAFNFL